MKPRSDANSRNVSSEIGTIDTGRKPPTTSGYVGRFAPSPTGPLHFGSLVAAVASYLQARSHQGRWLLRIEDIDPPREQPGAAENILATLEAYGFVWDGAIGYQSTSRAHHEIAIQQLLAAGSAYRCGCSRRDLVDVPAGRSGTIYPGTCRTGTSATETALRVRTNDSRIRFDDLVQGEQVYRLESGAGDFVILRKDGLVAYQLAVVVDDHLQGITEVVRGLDLIDSTPRQIWLQHLLGYQTPEYAHIPIAVDGAGQKLSKNQGAPAISSKNASSTLYAALKFLGQEPPQSLQRAPIRDLWQWVVGAWDISLIRGMRERSVSQIVDQV